MRKLKSTNIKLAPKERYLECERPIIALTGGIATGKSAASQIFKALDVPLIDADKLVKSIYKDPMSIKFIKAVDPQLVSNDKINFKKLREIFFNNKKIKQQVESYIYSRLSDFFYDSYHKLNFKKCDFLIYDIPLLFEKNLQEKFDTDLLIYAPREVQAKRLIKRDQISDELASKILDQQTDIEHKRHLAKYVISNIYDINTLESNIKAYLERISE